MLDFKHIPELDTLIIPVGRYIPEKLFTYFPGKFVHL